MHLFYYIFDMSATGNYFQLHLYRFFNVRCGKSKRKEEDDLVRNLCRALKEKIYNLVEPPNSDNQKADLYDVIMFISILASIIPLAFKTHYLFFDTIDIITFFMFLFDYFLRWITADIKLNKGLLSYLKYPFTPMAIIDLLSILPSVTALNNGLKLFRILRLSKALRVFRVFKAFRYSKNVTMIINVFQKQKNSLFAMCCIAGAYILISALIIFNVEPQSFDTFFDAIYWATVSLTTVGYGDIYPVTTIGRIITMISSVFGIAIIAMPAGIITAGILDELNNLNE